MEPNSTDGVTTAAADAASLTARITALFPLAFVAVYQFIGTVYYVSRHQHHHQQQRGSSLARFTNRKYTNSCSVVITLCTVLQCVIITAELTMEALTTSPVHLAARLWCDISRLYQVVLVHFGRFFVYLVFYSRYTVLIRDKPHFRQLPVLPYIIFTLSLVRVVLVLIGVLTTVVTTTSGGTPTPCTLRSDVGVLYGIATVASLLVTILQVYVLAVIIRYAHACLWLLFVSLSLTAFRKR